MRSLLKLIHYTANLTDYFTEFALADFLQPAIWLYAWQDAPGIKLRRADVNDFLCTMCRTVDRKAIIRMAGPM